MSRMHGGADDSPRAHHLRAHHVQGVLTVLSQAGSLLSGETLLLSSKRRGSKFAVGLLVEV